MQPVTRADDALAMTGVGMYARYQLTPAFAVGATSISTKKGSFAAVDQRLQEVTLTGEYKLAADFYFAGDFRR